MDTQAPAVVAVVVTADPDASLEATLASLAAQDYEALSTLVIVNAGGEAVEARVRAVDPTAFVAILEENRGFGAGVNAALAMVEGAQFLLLCHDDVVLRSDAVHLMVEESFRSNAGIVTPKFVTVENHSILLHVGQGMDRFGTVVERVQPGEFDQGQHDVVRDVFVAPGGATLIRDDLIRSIEGFDPAYRALGEDVDLSWRAQIVGARIICAPQAVVAHSERLINGTRPASEILVPADAPSLGRIIRRNQLRTLVKNWGVFERVLTLLMLIALDLGELFVAIFGRDVQRAVDIREAWRTWWRERKAIKAQRSATMAKRSTSDRVIRANQVHGATRLRSFLTTLFHHGYDAARGVIAIEEDAPVELSLAGSSFGGAFSDDEGFDELDDLGKRGAKRDRNRRRLSSARSVWFLAIVAIVVYLIGSRNLIGSRLPLIGQFVPLGTWTNVWHHVVASWQAPGLGNGAPTQPGYAMFGILGTLTLGHLGAVERLLLIGAIPLGAWGVSRLIKPVASSRARLLGAVAYGGLGLGANAIAEGRLGATVALGAAPFLIQRIFRLTRTVPFDEPFAPYAKIGTRGWRATRQGAVLSLALLLALSATFAPALIIVVLIVAFGSALAGSIGGSGVAFRGFGQVVGAVLVSLVLLFPLTITTGFGGLSGFGVFGVPSGPWSTPGLGGLLRFAIGPNGGGALAWLLPLAAAVPLILARQRRFGLSVHLAGAGLVSLAFALFTSRGGIGSFAPDLFVCLTPVAVAIAGLVGLGLAAFEDDLADLKFSWRQIVGILGITVAFLGLLPIVGSAGNGRWKMPMSGYSDALSFLNGSSFRGHRILWLGDPNAIPGASWAIKPGLAWSTSTDGLPGMANLFAPPSATAANAITGALELALQGDTVQLGRLLAPTGVQAIVVVSSVAPTVPGVQTGVQLAPVATLLPALDHQGDLIQIPGGGGAVVYEDPLSLARFSTRAVALNPAATNTSLAAISGWRPVAGTTGSAGLIAAGQRYGFVGNAPAGDFSVTSPATSAVSSPAFGWAQTVSVASGPGAITLQALPLNALIALLMIGGWIAAALLLVGRHRWLDWWWKRQPRHAAQHSNSGDEESTI